MPRSGTSSARRPTRSGGAPRTCSRARTSRSPRRCRDDPGMTFAPGSAIALREILRGQIWAARPAFVVQDEPELLVLFLPIGNRWIGPDVRDRDDLIRTKATSTSWTLVERTWTR